MADYRSDISPVEEYLLGQVEENEGPEAAKEMYDRLVSTFKDKEGQPELPPNEAKAARLRADRAERLIATWFEKDGWPRYIGRSTEEWIEGVAQDVREFYLESEYL
jgi:plasmid stabilization system protein ParE